MIVRLLEGVVWKFSGRSRNSDHSVKTASAASVHSPGIQAAPADQMAGKRSTVSTRWSGGRLAATAASNVGSPLGIWWNVASPSGLAMILPRYVGPDRPRSVGGSDSPAV